METQTFTTDDDVRIAWYSFGDPKAPTMVLSNGLGGNTDVWRLFIDYFKDRWRLVSWDYRGLYNSGPAHDDEGYAIERHVADLDQLLEVAEVADPVLIGWSMGVQVNFEACRDRPDRARALIAINGTSGRPFSTVLGTRLLEHGIPPIIQTVKAHWDKVSFLGPMALEIPGFLTALQTLGLAGTTLDREIFYQVARSFVRLDMGIYMEIMERLGAHDATDVLPSLTLPTLVIAGQKDVMTPRVVSERMVEQLPNAELCVVPAATHYCPIEFPELVHLRIEKFLRDHLKEGK